MSGEIVASFLIRAFVHKNEVDDENIPTITNDSIEELVIAALEAEIGLTVTARSERIDK
jgi:hypothetical protein